MPIGIVVHGGAGRFQDDEYPEAVAACREAALAGQKVLTTGGSALDAVEAAIRSLESAPILNAGHGATINRDGDIELDAMILEGRAHKHQLGAVAAVRRIEHPITLARYVMERTNHHLLVGEGAEKFAKEQNIPLIDSKILLTERQIKGKHSTEDDAPIANDMVDTVGAVALDTTGNLVVGVSTGGVRGKLPGRVGDSAVFGAGGYADNDLGGACATGVGEGIIRSLLTFRAVESLRRVATVQEAAQDAIDLFTNRYQGDGGLIMLDKQGRVGIAHNSEHMPVAWLQGDQIMSQITQSDN